MRTLETTHRRALGLLLAYAAAALPLAAPAADHLESRLPPPNDDCRLVIQPDDDSAQAKRDAERIKHTLDRMIAGSDDMREKVKDACDKNNNAVVIFPKRDDPATKLGGSTFPLFILIDLGDLSALELAMSGKSKDVKKLLDNFLIDLLAHEIDHMRGRDHVDPPANGGTGKPVDDGNKVMRDLKLGITRNGYSKRTSGFNFWIEYTVDGQKVLVSSNILEEHLWIRRKYKIRTPQDLRRGVIKNIPDGYCDGGAEPCYPFRPDADRDGVFDFEDNCLIWVNPSQLDLDGDGLGHGCDPDDDGDGWVDLVENAVGALSTEPGSIPEHWTSGACSNGRDDDGDGFIDAEDRSCTLPPLESPTLPRLVAVEAVYPPHLRMDLGGVREDEDLLAVRLELALDWDRDGAADDEAALDGYLLLRRLGDLADDASREAARLDLEVVALDARGKSAALGAVKIALAPASASTGTVSDVPPDPARDLPARLRLDLLVTLDAPSGPLTAHVPLAMEGRIRRWPFVEDSLATGPGGAVVALRDAAGEPVATIVHARLTALAPARAAAGR